MQLFSMQLIFWMEFYYFSTQKLFFSPLQQSCNLIIKDAGALFLEVARLNNPKAHICPQYKWPWCFCPSFSLSENVSVQMCRLSCIIQG